MTKEKSLFFSFLTFFIVMSHTTQASAEQGELSVEFAGGISIGPGDPGFDFGTTLTGGVGVGYMVNDDIQILGDIRHFRWEDDFNAALFRNINLKLQNIPVFLGERYFVSANENVRVFVELGLSVNHYKAEFRISGVSKSESEVKIGFVPGVGIKVMVTDQIGVGVNGRYYYTSDGVGGLGVGKTNSLSIAGLISYHP